MKTRLIDKLYAKYPDFAQVMGDRGKRAVAFLLISLVITLLFAIYNAVLAIVYKAAWNIVLGGYYTVLLASKIGVLFGFGSIKRYEDNAELHGAVTYLISGIVLLILHTPLVFLVDLIKINAFHYAGVLIYAYAFYAFYKIIAAIVNCVKTAKHKLGLVMQSVRNINLADAMVSVLALQTALISTFDKGTDFAYANVITGGVICAIVMLCSIYMIVRASILLAKIRRQKRDGKR